MSQSSRIEEFSSWIVVTFQDCTVSDGFLRQVPIDVVICACREAGIVYCLNVRSFAHRQIGQAYQGIRLRKGYQKAVDLQRGVWRKPHMGF